VPESRPPVPAHEPEGQGDPDFWGAPSRRELRRPHARLAPGDGWAGILDRLRDGRVGVVVLAVLALAAGVVFYKVGSDAAAGAGSPAAALGRTRPRSTTAPATSTTGPTTVDPVGSTLPARPVPASSTKAAEGRVVVHVAGAVVTPGVVTLAAGSRVIDAVEAAGGALPSADLDRLNLAAKVVDGQRVLVQHVGDPPAAADPSAAGGDGTGAPASGPLDLNAATQAQLEALPGIGPSLAQAIIAERTRKGGFRSVNELQQVHGIGERRFAELKTLVTV